MLGLFKKKSVKKQLEPQATSPLVKSGTMAGREKQRRIYKSNGRKLQGVVVSDKMNKTAIIAVTYLKLHSKYRKYVKITRRFKAHDENDEYHNGDKVIIQETRPMSKEKRWVIISKVKFNKIS